MTPTDIIITPIICMKLIDDLAERHQPNCCTNIDPIMEPIKLIVIVRPAPIFGTVRTVANTNDPPSIPPNQFQTVVVFNSDNLGNRRSKINEKTVIKINPVKKEINAACWGLFSNVPK